MGAAPKFHGGIRDMAGLIKSADSVWNYALGPRITPPNIGGLKKIIGLRAELRLGDAGNAAKWRWY